MIKKIEFPWYGKMTLILGGITLLIYVLIQARAILVPFLFALFFAILLTPLSSYLERHRLNRLFSSLISIILGITFLFGILYFFYFQLVTFAQDMGMIENRIEELFNQFSGFFHVYLAVESDIQLNSARDAVITFLRENVEPLTRGAITAATTITMFFLIPIYSFLLLMYRGFLKNFVLLAFSHTDNNNLVEIIIIKIRDVVQNYITGIFLVICILAVLNSTALTIIGVEHALFFGVFAAILNVIPFLGPIFGSILPILYSLLAMDSLWYPVAVLATFYVIQLFESNLFTPLIVGNRVSLNPLVTLLSIFIGAQIWGLAGMILIIPGLAILKEVFDEVESLRPYGYLLGRVKTREQTEKEYVFSNFTRFNKFGKISGMKAWKLSRKREGGEKRKQK